MLSFKEYVNLNFKNFMSERIKGHFLYFVNLANIFPYDAGLPFTSDNFITVIYKNFNYNSTDLKTLEQKQDGSEIKFFVKEIDANNFLTSAFENFKESLDYKTEQGKGVKKYYDFVSYYLMSNNLPNGISSVNKSLSKKKKAEIALKEIYAKEMFELAKALNIGIPDQYNEDLKSKNIQFIPTFKTDKIFLPFGSKSKAAKKGEKGRPSFKLHVAWDSLKETIDNNLINIIDNAWGE